MVSDLRRIRNHPLVPEEIPVRGFLYDVATGRLGEVGSARELEKAS